MFEQFLGLYQHPLAVHVPIVLVPLLALVAVAYALVPRVRRQVAWVAVTLAVVTPLSALVAKLSGEALAAHRYGPQLSESIAAHSTWGNRLVLAVAGLGVLTLALVWVRSTGQDSKLRAWVGGGLTVLVILAAIASGWFIFEVGHSGSEFNWRVPG